MWLILSCGNRIYGNNFDGKKDNIILQAYVSAISANPTWDNGTIGNYWNTYLNMYPSTSEIETSGIGDVPFVINGDNIDHFPLMSPPGPLTINMPEVASPPLPTPTSQPSSSPMSAPQNEQTSTPDGQNREGGNNKLLPASYLALAVAFVVIIVVAVTAIVLARNHRM